MRRAILLVTVLAAGGVATLVAMAQPAEASPQACLTLWRSKA